MKCGFGGTYLGISASKPHSVAASVRRRQVKICNDNAPWLLHPWQAPPASMLTPSVCRLADA